MARSMRDLFLDHPHKVNETYLQHMRASLSYAGRMAAAAFCALVHAFLPFLFERSASTMVRRMVAEMNARMGQPHGHAAPGTSLSALAPGE